MHMKRCGRILTLLILILFASSLTVAERRERLIDEWRPVHYDVSITLNEKLTEISSARTEISALVLRAPITSLNIDFGEMPIDALTVDGGPAKYLRSSGTLIVTLTGPVKTGDVLKIVVVYHGRPKDGLILTADKDGRPSATGDNWPNRVHHWIPSLDHPSAKATVRFTVTAPAHNLVVANGRLESTTSNSKTMRTWIWNEGVPISPYCMIIAVGDYARFDAQDQTIAPLSYYVPQSNRRFAMQGFAPASPSLKFFTETVGPYPYEKLAMIVGATRYGGMENSSAIVFSSNLFTDFETKQPRSAVYAIPVGVRDVVSHEIAHQWFGDSVTEATWADLWLSEGFATYFEGLFIERYEGKEQFRTYMKEIGEKYFRYEKGNKTPIHDKDTEDLNALLNPNNYEKGAWVLHMLRGLTGDKAFFLAIRDYYATHRDSTATTEDLRKAMETASGLDLKDFFERWVYKSGHPYYQITWKWHPSGDPTQQGFVELQIRQTQVDKDAFLIPLTVEIVTCSGSQRLSVTPKGKEFETRIPVMNEPTALTIDPDENVLKEMTLKQSR
jgi:aminopeptidase N